VRLLLDKWDVMEEFEHQKRVHRIFAEKGWNKAAMTYSKRPFHRLTWPECAQCDEDDADLLFEQKPGWFWCACCWQHIHNKTWNPNTKRWWKNRCECHGEIQVFDEDECQWVCPKGGGPDRALFDWEVQEPSNTPHGVDEKHGS